MKANSIKSTNMVGTDVFFSIPLMNADASKSSKYAYLVRLYNSPSSYLPYNIYLSELPIEELKDEFLDVLQSIIEDFPVLYRQSIRLACLNAINNEEDTIDLFEITPLCSRVKNYSPFPLCSAVVSAPATSTLELLDGSYE